MPKLRHVMRRLAPSRDLRILDVGAGNGTYATHLAEYGAVTGTDLSRKMLHGIDSCAVSVAQADAVSLPFRGGSFDLVWAACLLHHLASPAQAVAECVRVSARWVVLIEPNRANPAQMAHALVVAEERRGVVFSVGHVRRLAVQAGLRVLSCWAMGSVLPNATPLTLLPVVRLLDWISPWGINTVLIGEKRG